MDARPKRNTPHSAFWRTKSLDELDPQEWESLCDGCGQCCLVKLEDEDSDEVHYTDVSCKLLDLGSCRCTDYDNRDVLVDDCVRLTPQAIRDIAWLPPTCAYRLLEQGRPLPWWHPLVSGTGETVIEAGISVRGKATSERDVPESELRARIIRRPPDRR